MLLSKTQLKAFCNILKVGSKKANNFMNFDYPQYVAISENNLKYSNGYFAIELYNDRSNFEDEELTIVKTSDFLELCKAKKYEVSNSELLGLLDHVEYKYLNIEGLVSRFELKPIDKFMLFKPDYYECLLDHFGNGILDLGLRVSDIRTNGQGMIVVHEDNKYDKKLSGRFILMALRD